MVEMIRFHMEGSVNRLSIVNSFSQFLACPEVRHSLGRNRDCLASLGITPDSGWAVIDHEAAKATDFDSALIAKCHGNAIEDVPDRQFDVWSS